MYHHVKSFILRDLLDKKKICKNLSFKLIEENLINMIFEIAYSCNKGTHITELVFNVVISFTRSISSIFQYTHLSIYLSIYLSVCLSVCLSLYLSIYPSIILKGLSFNSQYFLKIFQNIL